MTFEERVEHLKDVVATHFPYNDVFVDKLPRNKRTGVRLAKIKFASYDTDDQSSMYEVEDYVRDVVLGTELQICSVNSYRSCAMFTKVWYDSLIVHMVIDKY